VQTLGDVIVYAGYSSSVTLAAALYSSSLGGSAPTSLVAPLGPIQSVAASAASPPLSMVVFTPSVSISLAAGKRYWVVLSMTSAGTFEYATSTVAAGLTNSAGRAGYSLVAGLWTSAQQSTLTASASQSYWQGLSLSGGSSTSGNSDDTLTMLVEMVCPAPTPSPAYSECCVGWDGGVSRQRCDACMPSRAVTLSS
jgi:hypothetical protein